VRSYLSRKSASQDASGAGVTSPASASSSSSRLHHQRETQSETRDASNNNNNNDAGDAGDDAGASTAADNNGAGNNNNNNNNNNSSSSSRRSDAPSTALSRYRERSAARAAANEKSPAPEPRSIRTTPFKSRFLKSSVDSTASSGQPRVSNGAGVAGGAGDDAAPPRPSVADLRRRYDCNLNALKKAPARSRSSSESDADQTAPASVTSSSAAAAALKEDKSALRSCSPSTLSSSSDGGQPLQDADVATPSTTASSAANGASSDSRRWPKSKIGGGACGSGLGSAAAASNGGGGGGVNGSESKRRSQLDRAGLVGLRNIGNTCFMNSVLQCLSNSRPLLEYVLSDEYSSHLNTCTSSMNGALMNAFASVLSELWTPDQDDHDDSGYSPSPAVNPTALKSQIQKFAPRFMGYNQQDSQEFLRYLLEGLHEDVNRISQKLKPLDTDIDDNLSDLDKSAEAWRRYLRRDDSNIVDLFVGQLKSTLQCTVCGHCSVTFDPFWDLSLPIPGSAGKSSSIKHCLDLFAKEEILDGDEKPTCSKCQTRRKCTKTFSIQKFPRILVLHLKRFSPGERFRKLDGSVDFPLSDLDLSAYCAATATTATTPCTYQLYGVINHSGSAYSGHYTASCRHPFSATWHEYNDSRVTGLSAHRIVSSEAYLLFYEIQRPA